MRASILVAMLVLSGCKGAKDDFRDHVCGALAGSGGNAGAPNKDDLAGALIWANANTTTKDAKMVVELASMEGIAKTHVATLLRVGGKEKAKYDGPCALADAFEKVYPCPAGDPTRCGKDAK